MMKRDRNPSESIKEKIVKARNSNVKILLPEYKSRPITPADTKTILEPIVLLCIFIYRNSNLSH